MKVSHILKEAEQEFIPHGETTAEAIAQQFVRRAKEEAYKRGRTNDPQAVKKLTDVMVNRFANKILKAIDQELEFSTMRDARSQR